MIKPFNTYIPTKLVFGCGSIKDLATLPPLGKKALVVISAGKSVKENGSLDKTIAAIHSQNIETVIFNRILPNPIKDHVMQGAEICRQENCDFVVGLGGGSTIDSAKSIAVMATNSGDYWDYVNGGTALGKPLENKVLPIIAIPTTAGTGTEIDPWTVITHNNEKIGFGIDQTFPTYAIVDPELMLSVPPRLTAYQGFDAFFHSAEGYIANCATTMSDMFALKSIALIYKSLAIAVKDGNNLEARTDIALASTLAGMVESTSCCISEHSLEHALSAFYPEIAHGEGLIAISIAYFKRFLDQCPDRYITMAEAMTGKKTNNPYDFITALEDMQKACGVDNIALSEKGVKPEDFPKLVENAKFTMGGLFNLDPRPLTNNECIDIYKESYR